MQGVAAGAIHWYKERKVQRMNERMDTSSIPGNGQQIAARSESTSDRPAPTRADRQELVRAYQTQQMQRPNPLAANLGIITGDLINTANHIRELMEKNMVPGTASVEHCRRFDRQAELYLKFVRQVDRLAQITCRLADTDEEEKESQRDA